MSRVYSKSEIWTFIRKVKVFVKQHKECYVVLGHRNRIEQNNLTEGVDYINIKWRVGHINSKKTVCIVPGNKDIIVTKDSLLSLFCRKSVNEIIKSFPVYLCDLALCENHFRILKSEYESRENRTFLNLTENELAHKKWEDETKLRLIKDCTHEEYVVYKYMQNYFQKCKIEFQKKIKFDDHLYFIDIYIPNKKIGIEVDGAYHFNKKQRYKDIEREYDISKFGIKIFRITNAQALNKDYLLKFAKMIKNYH